MTGVLMAKHVRTGFFPLLNKKFVGPRGFPGTDPNRPKHERKVKLAPKHAYRLASLFLMLFSPRGVSAACMYALFYILGVLFTYRLASLFLMLFSPRGVSAACMYALFYILGVLFTYRLARLFLMLFSPRGVSAGCIYASIHVLGVLSAYLLARVFQMLFSPCTVSACIYASIYALGVMFTYGLAIYVFDVLSSNRLTAAQESLNLRKHPRRDGCTGKPQAYLPNNAIIVRFYAYGFPACFACKGRSAYQVSGFIAGRGTPFDRIPRPHRYAHTKIKLV
jgi:hypothetical protein